MKYYATKAIELRGKKFNPGDIVPEAYMNSPMAKKYTRTRGQVKPKPEAPQIGVVSKEKAQEPVKPMTPAEIRRARREADAKKEQEAAAIAAEKQEDNAGNDEKIDEDPKGVVSGAAMKDADSEEKDGPVDSKEDEPEETEDEPEKKGKTDKKEEVEKNPTGALANMFGRGGNKRRGAAPTPTE